RVQAVLLDLMLPNASGLMVIRKLRAAKAAWRKHLPIIVMTSRTDSDTYKMAARRGIQGYLLKPLSAGLLVDTLSKALAASGVVPPKAPVEQPGIATVASVDLPPTLDDSF